MTEHNDTEFEPSVRLVERTTRAIPTDRRTFLGGLATLTVTQGGLVAIPQRARATSDEEPLRFGEGVYGQGGFGGVRLAIPDVNISTTGPSIVEIDEPTEYDVNLKNDGDGLPENVVVKFTITHDEQLDSSAVELGYFEDEWRPIPLTEYNGSVAGTFGPEDGFSLPEEYDETTEIRVTFSEQGDYEVTIDVVGVELGLTYARAKVDLEVVGESRDLLAGQDIPVGNVIVANDLDQLEVRYVTNNEWELTETHLAVADDLDTYEAEEWLTPRGSPRPGRFPYSEQHGPTNELGYTVSFDEPQVSSDGDLVIASHAEVRNRLQKPDNELPESTTADDGFAIEITDSDDEIETGEVLYVSVFVINNGNEDDTQTVELTLDGDIMGSEEITLDAGESKVLTLEWESDDGDEGIYTASVSTDDDSDAVWVRVDVVETAWGDGKRFVERGDWATYFEFGPPD